MTSSEIEIQNKVIVLKSEIFDLIRQGEYIANLKNQKLQELSIMEDNIRKTNIKPVEKTTQ